MSAIDCQDDNFKKPSAFRCIGDTKRRGMVSAINTILPPALQKQLTAIKQADRASQDATIKLASGLDVNFAIDDPLSFFTSQTLRFRASDLSRLLDGIGNSIRAIEVASDGVDAVLSLIDQAEALVQDALINLFPATDEEVDQRAIDYIRSRNADKGYFDTLGNFYQNTTEFVPWQTASENAATAELNAVPEIRGHLATITSQEENDVIFGLLTATSWLGGSDDEVEGVWRWVEGPETGQQFWQGVASGFAPNGAYENWAPAEPNQFFGPGNPENFAHLRADGLWNDLPGDRNLNYIIEWGGDLFVQNGGVNVSTEAVEYRENYLNLLEEIERVAVDAQYRGIGLLNNEDLTTIFNPEQTSRLVTEGIDVSAKTLGIIGDNFFSRTELTKSLDEIQAAREILREYATSLSVDLSAITIRRDFIRESIISLNAGSDDLTIADQNQVGAELLAIQTRQAIQFQTLGLAAQGNARAAQLLFS